MAVMPATPAWPPKSAPRLFVPGPLSAGGQVSIDGAQAHYLARVMRVGVGDVVILTGRVNAAFGSSLEVEVQVQVEDRATGHRTACVDAFMTFVAVGDDRKPTKQPPLRLETADDERREREARGRRQARLERRKTP